MSAGPESEWPIARDVLSTGSPVLFAAQLALTAAVRAAAKTRKRVPCLVVSEPLWLSSSTADQRRAARSCKVCPVIAQCGAVADAQAAPFGVWAGRIYSIKARRRRRPQGQVLPPAAARRLRTLVKASEDTRQRSPQQQARNQALFLLSSAGWSSSALADAAGLSRRKVTSIISSARHRNRTTGRTDRAA